MKLKTFVLVLIFELFKYGLCQYNGESSQDGGYEINEHPSEDLMAIESKPKPFYSKGNHNFGYVEKKVTTIKHAPKLHFQIGKPIYEKPMDFKSLGSKLNWIKSPTKSTKFGHGKHQASNSAPKFPTFNLKEHGITKQLNNLIPSNFGIPTKIMSSPIYDYNFGTFKTSSLLPTPEIATPQLAAHSFGSEKKPTELYFSPNIASLDSGDFKLEIPKNYGVETLKLHQPQVHQSTPSEGTPINYAPFIPGASGYDGKTPEHFENYETNGKSGEANSYVKVTNGKTTYYYQIRHLVKKH